MKFNVGQEVVCIKRDTWRNVHTKLPVECPGPKFNEIVTVEGYKNETQLFIVQYRYSPLDGTSCSFKENNFAPLITDKELAEQLESVPSYNPQIH